MPETEKWNLGLLEVLVVKRWEFEVGVNERHIVRIEQEREKAFPAFRPQKYRVYKDKTKEATQSQTESNEYKAIEDKIRKIVADYLQVEVDKIKVDTPITGDRVSTREVEIIEIMMKVEKVFSIDFSKEFRA